MVEVAQTLLLAPVALVGLVQVVLVAVPAKFGPAMLDAATLLRVAGKPSVRITIRDAIPISKAFRPKLRKKRMAGDFIDDSSFVPSCYLLLIVCRLIVIIYR